MFTVKGKAIFLSENETIHLARLDCGLSVLEPRTRPGPCLLFHPWGNSQSGGQPLRATVPATDSPPVLQADQEVAATPRPTLQANAPHSRELSPHLGLTHGGTQGKSAPQAGH